MTARLDTLDDHRVRTRIGRRSRRVPRSDLYEHSRASSPRARNELRAKPEGKRHDRRTLLNSHLKPLVLLKIEHKIHAKRAIRYPPDRSDLLAQDPQLSPRRAQRAEASRSRHLASESSRGGAGDGRLHDGNVQAKSAHDASLQRVDETSRRAQSSLPFANKQPRRSGPDRSFWCQAVVAFGGRALGSVSERVVHDAPCSVLVMRPEDVRQEARAAS